MSNDLKEFLRRMASEAPARPGIPPRLPRRVRRRRVLTVAASVTAVAVAAYGGTIAVQALRRPSTVVPATPSTCSWETVPAPRFGPEGFENRLLDISVAPDGSAWAVGDIYEEGEGGKQESLALRWTGDEWTVADHPPLQSLTSVATIGENDAWAVGFQGNQDVALHWNGERWADIPLADPGARYWVIDDVASNDAGEVWAVGGTLYEPVGTLVERWNGDAWQIVSTPGPEAGVREDYAGLEGIDALAPDLAWAVGQSGRLGPGGPTKPLVVRWDGHSWERVETPDDPAGRPHNYLFAVAGVPSGEAWAVGITNSTPGIGGGGDHALALHGDAEGWSTSQLPPVPEDSRLFGVATRSPTEVFAVGSTGFVGTYRTLVLRWDGQAWERVSLPVEEGWLQAATLDSASNVWVAGQTADGKPLVLKCAAGG